jgi:hypothetical protein
MRTVTRSHCLLLAALTVWCLGCDAFETVAKSFSAPAQVATATAASVESGDDDCHCVLGHAAVIVASPTPGRPIAIVSDFVDLPPVVLLPRPEPPLRPPVA